MTPPARGDEDKGSPSRDGANFALTPSPLPMGEGCPKDRVRVEKKSKVQRKPFGYAITRFIFPSENQLCNNTA
jgi:hypothetical protein